MKTIADQMTTQYLVTGLWSTSDYERESEHLDDKFVLSDISLEFVEKAKADCAKFYELTKELYQSHELDFEQIGHDFWLTRNRHGAGFWDGDYEKGKEITEICQKHFPENDDELNESIEREA